MIRLLVHKAMITTLASEIPGVRVEVHRKIAKTVGTKVAAKLEAFELENARLIKENHTLRAKLHHLGTKRFRNELQKTIQFLNEVEDKTHGED